MIETLVEAPAQTRVRSVNRWEPSAGWSILFVALAALAVYANTLANGFAYDDDYIIVRNDRLHQLADLKLIWDTPYWPSFGTVLGLYRPLSIFAYALQWAVGHGHPFVFHLTNTLLHAGICVLVLLLLRQLVSGRAALLGAIVFAVHPVHTETVANCVGQAELLSAAGVLAACVLYARRPRESARVGWPLLVLIPLCYLLALFAKEAAITLPALLVALDLGQRRVRMSTHSVTQYTREVWLLFFLIAATAVLYLSIRVDVLGSIGGSDAAPGLPFLREQHRILTAFRAWPEYVRLLFFPKDLSADYSPAIILPVESLTPMAILGAAILLGTVTLSLLLPLNVAAGLPAAWFMISIITISNLLFPVGVVLAERTLYMPSVAVAFIAAFAWQALDTRAAPRQWRLGAVVAMLALALMSYRSIERNRDWKSTIAILNALVHDHPESYHTAWLLADQYWRRGDVQQSAYFWNAAMLLWPRDSQLLLEFANFNIGQKNWKRAIELLERSRSMHPWVPRVHEMLAFCYVNAGRPADALVEVGEAFQLGSLSGLMYAIWARAYDQLGRYGSSVGAWRIAINQKIGGLWIYRPMLIRALARYGEPARALALADTLEIPIRNDTLAMQVLNQVRAAVKAGCYAANAPKSCPDPLAGWGLAVDAPPTR